MFGAKREGSGVTAEMKWGQWFACYLGDRSWQDTVINCEGKETGRSLRGFLSFWHGSLSKWCLWVDLRRTGGSIFAEMSGGAQGQRSGRKRKWGAEAQVRGLNQRLIFQGEIFMILFRMMKCHEKTELPRPASCCFSPVQSSNTHLSQDGGWNHVGLPFTLAFLAFPVASSAMRQSGRLCGLLLSPLPCSHVLWHWWVRLGNTEHRTSPIWLETTRNIWLERQSVMEFSWEDTTKSTALINTAPDITYP